MKIILTGATGMVGEGVLWECLANDMVTEVLSISRKPYDMQHAKLKQLLVPDFTKLSDYKTDITGYDACFYCAGVSSVGKNEQEFTRLTYDTVLPFAKALQEANPRMKFIYVSGQGTDSSEKGRLMWARVKGKTENDLTKLGFGAVYNFRPGVMMPFEGQKNWKGYVIFLVKVIRLFVPSKVLSLSEVGKAMIKASYKSIPKHVLEVKDIKAIAE